jgi:hypothetical protein
LINWQDITSKKILALDAMPANKYDFHAVDSIRSFAEQMLHLAQGNVGLISNGTSAQRIFTGQNLEKIIYWLKQRIL